MKQAMYLGLICLLLTTSSIAQGLKDLAFVSDKAWLNFALPNIQIRQQPEISSVLWQDVTVDLIQQTAYNVARILYKNEKDAPKLPILEVQLENFDGVAWKEGDFDKGAIIHVSHTYLDKFQQQHGVEAAWQELVGILYHEIAHAYQRDDHNYKNIGGVIEGIADVVRYQAGYLDLKTRKPGGQYDQGYKTTAFFLIWLDEQNEQNLLQALNLSLDATDDMVWNWQHFEQQLGTPLEQAWQSYQTAIQ